jgi:hypothetical protein
LGIVSPRSRRRLRIWFVGPRAVPGKENAPSLHGDPDGPPKLLNLPNPVEMVQIPVRVFMFFELGHVWRTIWTHGRPLPKDPDRTWLGYSVGRWEGDTFIVATIGFKDKQGMIPLVTREVNKPACRNATAPQS